MSFINYFQDTRNTANHKDLSPAKRQQKATKHNSNNKTSKNPEFYLTEFRVL